MLIDTKNPPYTQIIVNISYSSTFSPISRFYNGATESAAESYLNSNALFYAKFQSSVIFYINYKFIKNL